MEFLRLYIGELTSLVLAVIVIFAAASAADRYFQDKRKIRLIRIFGIAAVMGAFALSLVTSLTVNQIPRSRINRSGADQDQKAYEQKHSAQAK